MADTPVTLQPEPGRLREAKMIRAEGYVWCHVHGNVHEDTTNPYDTPADRCPRRGHRPVYYRARKGDWV